MFLEDELEVTGLQVGAFLYRRFLTVFFSLSNFNYSNLQEDVYFKKKPSLLLLDPKSQEQGEHAFNERAQVVDTVPQNLL